MPGVSFVWVVAVLTCGGFFRSLEFTSLNTIAYADVDHRRHEPRHLADRGRAAIVDLGRGRGRGAGGRPDAVVARPRHHHGGRLPARLAHRLGDLGAELPGVLADAVRCGRRAAQRAAGTDSEAHRRGRSHERRRERVDAAQVARVGGRIGTEVTAGRVPRRLAAEPRTQAQQVVARPRPRRRELPLSARGSRAPGDRARPSRRGSPPASRA